MVRPTVLSGVAGLLIVVLLMGTFVLSNGVSEDLYAPLLVMGLPILLISVFVGVCVGAADLRAVPRTSVRLTALVFGLFLLATALWLMGVI